MAVRLRPQSSAWLAPTALAAQLTAQTGQIAGQGVAGLLGGIAQGVGAFTQKREQRRVEGINEQRYQDSLMRRDREFQYGAAKDQAALLEDYLKGAEAEIALSAVASPTGTPDPSKVQAYRTAQSSAQALRAQLAKIGGVSAPNIPPMPEPPPRPEGSFTPERREEYRKQVGYESLSDDELTTVAASLAADADSMKAELDAIVKIGGTKGAVAAAQKRTAYTNKSREAMIAEATLKRRQAKAESAQKRADLEAQAAKEVGVYADKQKIDESSDAARLAKINADRAANGQSPIPDLALVGPTATGERQDKTFDFKREQAESRAATKDAQLKMIRRWQVEDRDVREGRMAAKDASARAQFDVSESGRAVARAETHMNNLQDAFRMNKATKEELAQAADDLSEAKQMYEEAQARLKSLGVVAPVAGSPAPTPTSKGTADLVDEVFK